jgi:hypothetical protein
MSCSLELRHTPRWDSLTSIQCYERIDWHLQIKHSVRNSVLSLVNLGSGCVTKAVVSINHLATSIQAKAGHWFAFSHLSLYNFQIGYAVSFLHSCYHLSTYCVQKLSALATRWKNIRSWYVRTMNKPPMKDQNFPMWILDHIYIQCWKLDGNLRTAACDEERWNSTEQKNWINK